MNIENLREAFSSSTQDISALVNSCDPGQLSTRPDADSWSVLMVIEHLNISDKSAYIAMLKSEAVTDAGLVAAANEKLDRMEVAEGARLKAPETASPKGKFETHSQAMEQFLATRKKIENLMLQEDMSLMAAGFVHPKLGAMTREQWVRFLIWHTKHHQQQIGRILQATG